MRTETKTFFDEFSSRLNVFLGHLENVLGPISSGETSGRSPAQQKLVDVFQRLKVLSKKIDDQEAFLLIFGPLKSGKSTLMNAISGTYVSEVTSLPAYPALVYVKHGDSPTFNSTSYAGDTVLYQNNSEMSAAIDKAHMDLADNILQVERKGDSFDPVVHFADAIRRMDIEVDSTMLKNSGSILVDTPGLYSRMRFGYDLITRDFRDNAACAIFVVKADNLFFEKVFEEFTDLLGIFSKIFLVANIDTSKQDLQPDGSLLPSAESRNPEEVIDAFRVLAMNAELSEALDQGRLKIYPVDLLQAGVRRLKAEPEMNDEEEVSGNELSASDMPENDGFDLFLNDLSEYLTSDEYLDDAKADSLKLADRLKAETAEVASLVNIEVQAEQQRMVQQLQGSENRLRSLEEITNADWLTPFSDLYSKQVGLVEAQREKSLPTLEMSLEENVKVWMTSDESLKTLVEQLLAGPIEQQVVDDTNVLLQRLIGLVSDGKGGGSFTKSQERAFNIASISPAANAESLLNAMTTDVMLEKRPFSISQQDIPLNRFFFDSIFFRSKASINKRFFGVDGNRKLTSANKLKRLKGDGIARIETLCKEYLQLQLPEIESSYINRILDNYVGKFNVQLKDKIQEAIKNLQQRRQLIKKNMRSTENSVKSFADLDNAILIFGEELAGLEKNTGFSDSEHGNGGAISYDVEQTEREGALSLE